jgi:hypothetical protein
MSMALALQLGLTLTIFLLVALMPPPRGAILVLSLAGEDRGAIARWTIASDARLIGAGPLPHSFIVQGERGRLAAAALGAGAVLMAAPSGACSGDAA